MANPVNDQPWIDLEVAAWEEDDHNPNYRHVVERAARKKWQKLKNPQKQEVALRIQQYHAAVASVEAIPPTQHVMGPMPDQTDVPGLNAYKTRLATAISAQSAAPRAVQNLIGCRTSLPDTQGRTVRYLERIRKRIDAPCLSLQQVLNTVDTVLATARDAAVPAPAPAEVLISAATVDEQNHETAEEVRIAQGLLKHGWNPYGLIVDRVVIKEGTAGQSKPSSFWSDYVDLMPLEVAAMSKLTELPNSESIVQLRNWRRYPEDHPAGLEYRIYMEYCGGGDLWTLIRQYYQYKWKVETSPDPTLWLPEPFLWAVFESLVTAGQLMKSGNGAAGWYQIVHCDLKLTNLFLGDPSSKTYRGYPKPKIGDFGASLMIAPQPQYAAKDLFPQRSVGIGTKDARPPEQIRHIAQKDELIPDSRSNVWGVGFIMWSLISGREIDRSLLDFEEGNSPDSTEGRTPSQFPQRARQQYSRDLRDAVESCLRYDAGKRPKFEELVEIILENTGGGKHDRARDLRLADANSKKFDKYAILAKRDNWPLRTALLAGPNASKLPGAQDRPLRKARRNREDDSAESESEDELEDDLGGSPGKVLKTKAQAEEEARGSKRSSPDRESEASASKRARTDNQEDSPGGDTDYSPSSEPAADS